MMQTIESEVARVSARCPALASCCDWGTLMAVVGAVQLMLRSGVLPASVNARLKAYVDTTILHVQSHSPMLAAFMRKNPVDDGK